MVIAWALQELSPVFPSTRRDATDGCVRRQAVPRSVRRRPEKPADLSSHSRLEYSVRPDGKFELIAPEEFLPTDSTGAVHFL